MKRLDRLKQQFANSGVASELAYQVLREAIISGVLSPGTRIREQDISEEIGISRTPVREAIFKLQTEGLLRHVPKVGLVVPALSVEEILATYVPRAVLEGAAANLAARFCSDAEILSLERTIDIMEQLTKKGDVAELSKANVAFHDVIARLAHNEYLYRLLEQIWAIVKMCRLSSWKFPGRLEQATAEHRAIVEAIKARDGAEAERRARIHIEHAYEISVQTLTGIYRYDEGISSGKGDTRSERSEEIPGDA